MVHVISAICPLKKMPGEIRANTLDISDLGAALESSSSIKPGSNLILEFLIGPSESKRGKPPKKVKLTACVVYCDAEESGLYRIGVSFRGLRRRRESRYFELICSEPVRHHAQKSAHHVS